MKQILINSFVHANTQDDIVLFYNTLNGKYVVIENRTFSQAVKQLMESNEDNYLLPATDLSDEDIHCLTDALIGTLIENEHIPVQFIPRTFLDGYAVSVFSEGLSAIISEEDSASQKEQKEIEYLSLMGKNVMTYLSVVNIHYSSFSNEKYSAYQDAHKQYLYPQIGPSSLMDLEKVRGFIKEWKYIKRVNLIIGDIHEKDVNIINEFVQYLKKKNVQVNLYGCLCYSSIISSLLCDNLYCWVTNVDHGLNLEAFRQKGLTLLGLICGENDFEFVETLCGEANIFACNNSHNEQFCFESSGYELEEIMQEIISESSIRTNMTLNFNLFGTLWIYSDNKVYSCPNDNELGDIKQNTLKEILYKEFTVSKSWFKIRQEYTFCQDCIFNGLCPPITNFELCLKKTLCNKRKISAATKKWKDENGIMKDFYL